MKKTNMTAMAKKSAPKFIDDTHVLVTKEFAKNARIFGTPEYKLWREIKKACEDAEMVTKTIKKNTNTVIMNYKFAAAAATYGTAENKLMKDIRADFPGMTEVVVSGRVQTTAKANHRLTYENMEKHIRVYENADELLDVFETVKAASVALASPYKYVADWFKAQFPNYKDAVVFNDGKLTVAPVKKPDIIQYKQKLPKVG